MDNTSPYTEMILVSKNQYDKAIAAPSSSSAIVSKEMYKTAMSDLKDEQLPPDQYLMKYNTLTEARKKPTRVSISTQSDKVETKSTATEKKDEDVDEWITGALNALPKQSKARAAQLYHFLKGKHPEIRWNSQGEIILPEGEIRFSNIIDLINFMTTARSRKHENEPIGLSSFINALQRFNVPNTMLGVEGLGTINKQRLDPLTPQRRRRNWEALE